MSELSERAKRHRANQNLRENTAPDGTFSWKTAPDKTVVKAPLLNPNTQPRAACMDDEGKVKFT